ncbi:hypothetical protein [Streptomyces mirabilis]|uniref:hypothetical protein n=1 Tax=Streptomyces mirabilis TaxID=68239 RepID=UPI0036DD1FEF
MTTPAHLPNSYLNRPFPVQKTWNAGETVAAGDLDANIRDAVNYMLAPPRCIVYCANPQQAQGGTPVAFSLDTALTNTDGMWTPQNPSVITFNTPGVYKIAAYLHYPYQSGTGIEFHLGFAQNAGGLWPVVGAPNRLCEDTRQASGNSAFGSSIWISGIYPFNQGDYVQLFTTQTFATSAIAPAGGQFGSQVTARWVSTN